MKSAIALICLLLCVKAGAAPIERQRGEILFSQFPVTASPPPQYPWRVRHERALPQITKEHFRCRGSRASSAKVVEGEGGAKLYLEDCGGVTDHSLPLREGKEFIYPVLIDLLNKIQDDMGKRVVVTAGHRCPMHNSYVDASLKNSKSKHQLGAAVTFYVDGLESKPQEVLRHILRAYPDLVQSDEGWANKEFLIKIYWAHEGRDGDNKHPYPYLSAQVRFDRATNQRVEYTWKSARQPLYRW